MCVSAQTRLLQSRIVEPRILRMLLLGPFVCCAFTGLAPDAHAAIETPENPTHMLFTTQDLLSLAIVSTDSTRGGPIGEVKDLCFDDTAWATRHLVVKTGSWLSGRQVLISPMAAGKPDWTDKWLPTPLGRAQFEQRPDIDPAMTLRQPQETGRLGVDSHPHGWDGLGGWNGEGYQATSWPGDVGGAPATDTRAAPDAVPFRTAPGEHHTIPQLRSG